MVHIQNLERSVKYNYGDRNLCIENKLQELRTMQVVQRDNRRWYDRVERVAAVLIRRDDLLLDSVELSGHVHLRRR
jgi:hypothetical protein